MDVLNRWQQALARRRQVEEYLAGNAAAAGWTLTGLDAEGLRLQVGFRHPDHGEAQVWLMPPADEPSYRQAAEFHYGYRGAEGAEALRLVDSVFRWLQAIEGKGVFAELFVPPPGERVGEGAREELVTLFGGEQFEIRLTEACNEQCIYCNTPGGNTANLALTLDEVSALLAQARQAGASYLIVSGGEPLLVWRLPEALEEAVRLGFETIVVQTNATLLERPGLLDLLASRPEYHVQVSLPGHTAEVTGRITGRPDLFPRKVAGVKAVLERGIPLFITHVVCEQNRHVLEDYVRWVAAEFPTIRELDFSFVVPSGRGTEAGRETIPRASEAAPQLLGAARLAQALGLKVRVQEPCGIPTCLLPELREFAERYGTVDPGHTEPDKVKFDHCARCPWATRCSGVFRRYLELHGTDEFLPVE